MTDISVELEEKPPKPRKTARFVGILKKIPGLMRHQFRTSGKMRALFGVSLIINLLLWGALAYLFQPQEEPIFLHYNIFFGIDLIGPWWKIFYIPLSGFIILLINTSLSAASFKEDRALSFTVMSATIFFELFLFLTSFLIVLIN